MRKVGSTVPRLVLLPPPVAWRRRRHAAHCRTNAPFPPGPPAAAKLHPKRTYYYRQAVDLDKLIEQCSGKVRRWPPAAASRPKGPPLTRWALPAARDGAQLEHNPDNLKVLAPAAVRAPAPAPAAAAHPLNPRRPPRLYLFVRPPS